MYNPDMKTRIQKWGNSLGIRLPKVFAVHMGMEAGANVDVQLDDDRIVISKSGESLDALLSSITPDMLHGETDTGDAVGNEIW